MKSLRRATSVAAVLLVAAPVAAVAQRPTTTRPAAPAAPAAVSTDPATRLPVDPAVTVGTLPNGIRYYIRKNAEPRNRAELRLVVNAGSVLEDEDQRGLAHVIEHMAFNGTKNFPKNELVNFLESSGMRFGADVNAYTSFDETVYMLQLPTDSARVLAKGFDILEDWAHSQLFDTTEINKERGVVLEEWRLRRGAGARMQEKVFPVLFRGSRYADRLPIGTPENLEHFRPAVLRRFYSDWYRPDLMAVVAVGDFDKARIEALIRQHFSTIPAARAPRARPMIDVPGHDSTLVSIVTDKEATSTSVSVLFKQPPRPRGTVGQYRQQLVEELYNAMLNQRLYELSQKADPPFLGAGSSQGSFVRAKEVYQLGAAVRDEGVIRGLEALLTEAERVDKFGFTQSEIDRERTDMLRGLERAYAEREKTQSASYAGEYASAFLEQEPIPGIAVEYDLAKRLLPNIQLAEVNRLASEWITDKNRVILVQAPEKPGLVLPTEQQLLAVFDSVRKKTIVAYVDSTNTAPLVERMPTAGRIVAETKVPELGVTRWTLSNGVKVILKPTDFRADQVVMTAYSPGGTSLLSDRDFTAAGLAQIVVGNGGLGQLSLIELQKRLAGKVAGVTPYFNNDEEGLSGSASPKDLETLFQLAYLRFTAPREDSATFQAFRQQIRTALANRAASPEAAFADTFGVTMAQHHPRERPPVPALADSVDLRKSMAFYRDRFADASDFTFIFVGNFNVDSLRPLVQTYLGGLPALRRGEKPRDLGIRPPTGIVQRVVNRGVEPKSQTRIAFTGPFVFNQQNRYVLTSLSDVLNIALRERLREALGGTYTVGVSAGSSREPRQEYSLSIAFSGAPDRMEELVKATFDEIDSLRVRGPTDSTLAKVRETQRRDRETALRQNGFWLNTLATYDHYGFALPSVLEFNKWVDALTKAQIQEAARQYLRTDNFVRVTLYPENFKPQGTTP